MMWLISLSLELLAAAVILVPVYFVLNKTLFYNIQKSIIYCVFSFYLVAVYALVGMPNITYVRFELNLNLIPLRGLIDDLKNSILNVLLFAPLGFMLPILWRKYRTPKDTLFFGFSMSMSIELLQIFTFRATDINDLITNSLGTILGYGFASILMHKIPAVRSIANENKGSELYPVCARVFATMFLVQPFIFSILWDLTMH